MIRTVSLLGLTVALTAAHGLRINEIRTNQAGIDFNEFVELAGTPGQDISGLTYLVIGDHSGGFDEIPEPIYGSGTVEFAYTFPAGTTIPADGFFLMASTEFDRDAFPGLTPADLDVFFVDASNLFENNDNVTHMLVEGYTGGNVLSIADQAGELGIDIDNVDTLGNNPSEPQDGDGIIDNPVWTNVIDAISIVSELEAGEYLYAEQLGFENIGPAGPFTPHRVYRNPDTGAWELGIFFSVYDENNLPAADDTPGSANNPPPAIFPVTITDIFFDRAIIDFVIVPEAYHILFTDPFPINRFYQLQIATSPAGPWEAISLTQPNNQEENIPGDTKGRFVGDFNSTGVSAIIYDSSDVEGRFFLRVAAF